MKPKKLLLAVALTLNFFFPTLVGTGLPAERKIIKIILILFFILQAGGEVYAQSASVNSGKEILYTLDDRDRAIRTETKLESIQKQMDTRFEAMDDKLNKLYTLIYFVLGGVFGLIGLIMWDRRSYIKPVREDINELRKTLIEYSKDQPKLADILRSHGLM